MEEAHSFPGAVKIKTEPGLDESPTPCDQTEKSIHHPAGPNVWTVVKREEFNTEDQPVCKINISQEQLGADLYEDWAQEQLNSSENAVGRTDVTFHNGGVMAVKQSSHLNEEKGTEKTNTRCTSRLNRKRSVMVRRARFVKRRATLNKGIVQMYREELPPLRKRSALSRSSDHTHSGLAEERLGTLGTSSFCEGTCSSHKMGSIPKPSPGAVSRLTAPTSNLLVTTRPSSSSITIPRTPVRCGSNPCVPLSACGTGFPEPTPVHLFSAHEPPNSGVSGFNSSHTCSGVSPSVSLDSQPSETVTFPRADISGVNQIQSGQAFSELFKLVSGMAAHIQRLEYKVDSLLGRPPSAKVTASTQTDVTNFGYGGLGCGGSSSVNSLNSSMAADLAPVIIPENPVKQPVPQLSQSSQRELVAPAAELPFVDDRFWLIRPEQLSAQVTRDLLTQLTSSIVRFEPNCEALDLSEEELAVILRKSQSAATMARNLMYHCFTLGELFGRNATGVNYTGNVGQKKKAINQKKLQELVAVVRSHYDQDGLEKIIYNVINKTLSYLWSRKLKHPWLFLVEV